MRLLHLSDLHIGKSLGAYDLLEDQRHALEQILSIIESRDVDLVMIAGDIFDTSIPSSEALDLYSYFVERIVFDLNKKVLAIPGNHDSSKRLDINRKFYRSNNYYLVGDLDVKPISFSDDLGPINFYLIPFVSINRARAEIDDSIEDFSDIYRKLLENVDYKGRNVLITHCYATDLGGKLGKETYNEDQKPLSVGGSDFMDVDLFMDFDYVALGHLHRAHFVKEEKIRYAGTFMKYSFDEIKTRKSVTLVDLGESLEVEKIEISPLRDLEIREGFFEEILRGESSDAYIKFLIKDDFTIENAMAKLRTKFPHAVSLSYVNKGALSKNFEEIDIDLENKDLIDLFKDFYSYKMDEDLSKGDLEILRRIADETF